MSVPGLMIAAPASGTGKTTVMLGLLRALSARGLVVQPFKSGPDYIDPAFHRAACGRASFNLDSWAMTGGLLDTIAGEAAGADLVLAEGSITRKWGEIFDQAGDIILEMRPHRVARNHHLLPRRQSAVELLERRFGTGLRPTDIFGDAW